MFLIELSLLFTYNLQIILSVVLMFVVGNTISTIVSDGFPLFHPILLVWAVKTMPYPTPEEFANSKVR